MERPACEEGALRLGRDELLEGDFDLGDVDVGVFAGAVGPAVDDADDALGPGAADAFGQFAGAGDGEDGLDVRGLGAFQSSAPAGSDVRLDAVALGQVAQVFHGALAAALALVETFAQWLAAGAVLQAVRQQKQDVGRGETPWAHAPPQAVQPDDNRFHRAHRVSPDQEVRPVEQPLYPEMGNVGKWRYGEGQCPVLPPQGTGFPVMPSGYRHPHNKINNSFHHEGREEHEEGLGISTYLRSRPS